MDFIHSGSTLLNLALSGRPLGGWPLGKVSNVIGDKSTGKTLLAIEAQTLAVTYPPEGIKKVYPVYIDAEQAFDLPYAEQLGMPVNQVDFSNADTVEAMWKVIEGYATELKKGEGAFIVVDSWDAMTTEAELDEDLEKGTMDMGKQKQGGRMARRAMKCIRESNIHLMIISQIRENITALPFAPKWRRSGGKFLDFYASQVIWLNEIKKHKAKNDWVYGIQIQARVSKNKVAKPYREVQFPIIFEYGTDDIYSMVTFLTDKGIPKDLRIDKQAGGWYQWQSRKLRLEDLVLTIDEDSNLYTKLVQQTAAAWQAMEDMVAVSRTSKVELLSGIDLSYEEGEVPEIEEAEEPESEQEEPVSNKRFRRR